MIKTLFGAAVALGVLASPVTAQMTNTTGTAPAPMAHQKMMTTQHMTTKTTHMSTMNHMTRAQMKTMKWCKGMSHKRMMHYKSCRMMKNRHTTMHHHAMAAPKKAM